MEDMSLGGKDLDNLSHDHRISIPAGFACQLAYGMLRCLRRCLTVCIFK